MLRRGKNGESVAGNRQSANGQWSMQRDHRLSPIIPTATHGQFPFSSFCRPSSGHPLGTTNSMLENGRSHSISSRPALHSTVQNGPPREYTQVSTCSPHSFGSFWLYVVLVLFSPPCPHFHWFLLLCNADFPAHGSPSPIQLPICKYALHHARHMTCILILPSDSTQDTQNALWTFYFKGREAVMLSSTTKKPNVGADATFTSHNFGHRH